MGESVVMHSFAESLRRSHSVSDWPGWETIYRSAFCDFAGMVDHREDGEHQRAGIDRSVILSSSKQLLIDEKARFRCEKTGRVYEDILLEYWSDRDRRIPGWAAKPLRADFIAYAILPLGRCYLLPVLALQCACRTHGKDWKESYGWRKAHNGGWITYNVPVPWGVLAPAICGAMLASFDATEERFES